MKFHIHQKGLCMFLSLSMMISSLTISVSAQEIMNNDILNNSILNTAPQKTTTSDALDFSGLHLSDKIVLSSLSVPENLLVPSDADWKTVTETILPSTLESNSETGETIFVPVTWTCDNYDSTKPAETVFVASVILPENYILKDNTKDLTTFLIVAKTVSIDGEQNEFLIDSRNFSRTVVHPLPDNIVNYSGQLSGRSVEFYNLLENESNGKLKESNNAVIEIPVSGSFTFTDEADRQAKLQVYLDEIAQDFTDAFDAFYRDHSEIFWLDYPKYQLEHSYGGNTATLKKFKVTVLWDADYTTKNEITTDEATINTEVQSILNAVSGKSDYDKLKYFHDWLTKNNRYNPYIADGSKDHNTLGTHKPWKIVSAFLSKKDQTASPVCEGYARAFKVLCDKESIPNFLVSGTGNGGAGGGAHMWNYVKLDGNWYAVDVTWDDPILPGDQDGDGVDTYFMKGAVFFNQNHINDNGTVSVNGTSFAYPTLSANDYDPANPPTEYSITVNGGTTDKATAAQGETVTVKANIPSGKVFDKWTSSDGIAFADDSQSQTTFVMPAKNVAVTATFKEPAATEYSITVNSGTSDKTKAKQGEIVTVKANIPSGKLFDKWTSSDGTTFADASQSQTTFIMPGNNVTVTATFKDPAATEYSITVSGGSADKTKAKQGETVTVKANIPSGKVFDKWTSSDGITFANDQSETTTFVMPSKNVTVTATFKEPAATEYSITVSGGSADKTKAKQGETVTVKANIPSGKLFDKWTSSDGTTFADASQSQTTFIMPGNNVAVTATFKEPAATEYSITVNSGTSDKTKAKQGEIVTVKANIPSGKLFDRWTSSDGITFANDQSETTTFVMPGNNVTVTATFKEPAATEYSITVSGGSADKAKAAQGETVTVKANIPSGKVFDKWTSSDGITFANDQREETTFVMPGNNVTVTATFKEPAATEYSITVSGGSADKAKAAQGETVTVKANIPSGKVFDKWTSSDGITFANDQREETTFVMPAKNVTVTATFKEPVATEYSITVSGGSADKTKAKQGEIVVIQAVVPSGKVFDKWTSSDGITFANDQREETTFVMPSKNVTVTATFKEPAATEYSITVSGGSADKTKAKQGETVTVKAKVPSGKVFDKWTSSDSITFADPQREETTFVMPGNNVTVTATFKEPAATEYSITVNSGTSDKTKAKQGETVTVKANIPSGKVFDK